MRNWYFTSESVTEGHPDKIADRISDGVLDAVLTQDPGGRVACEVLLTNDIVIVAGEITTSATIDVEAAVRQAIREIGYNDPTELFSAGHLHRQSDCQAAKPRHRRRGVRVLRDP